MQDAGPTFVSRGRLRTAAGPPIVGVCTVLAGLVVPAGRASAQNAQPFARADDTRVRPPEVRQPVDVVGVRFTAGSTYLAGNVDNVAVNAATDIGFHLGNRYDLFVDGSAAHVFFGGKRQIDKDTGSLLYVVKLAPHWNWFTQSTHARNRFLKLDYRGAIGGGVCLHGFGGDFFEVLLVSAGVASEAEWWADDTRELTPRVPIRLTTRWPRRADVVVGTDFITTHSMRDSGDVRAYLEGYVEAKLKAKAFAIRVSATEEYDTRPRPGVRSSDFGLMTSLVIKLGGAARADESR